MSRFRQSKVKHVYASPFKKDSCFDNVKVTMNTWDSNLIKVNPLFVSVNWNAQGGGAFAILPLTDACRLNDSIPLYKGHKAAVLDTDFNPFNDYVIASSGEDAQIMVWNIPKEKQLADLYNPEIILKGHTKKVGQILFHPTASNVLASSSADATVKLWDVEKGMEKQNLTLHPEPLHSFAWNYDGSLIVTACRDKTLRIIDVRSGKIAQEGQGHGGVKGTRVTWLGDTNRFVSTGFSKTCDRQVSMWDATNLSKPLKTLNLDTSAGLLLPFFDADTSILFLAGKGDGNVRYFEVVDEEPYFHLISEYKSSEPQRGFGFIPKRAVNVNEFEIARGFKVQKSAIEPISFILPRKSEGFQADIYPNAIGDEPAQTSEEFFSGKNAKPLLISLANGFKSTEKKEFISKTSSHNTHDIMNINHKASQHDLVGIEDLKVELKALKLALAEKDKRISDLERELKSLRMGQ